MSKQIEEIKVLYGITDKEANKVFEISQTYNISIKDAFYVFKENESPKSINKIKLDKADLPTDVKNINNRIIMTGDILIAISYDTLIMSVNKADGRIIFDDTEYSVTTRRLQEHCKKWIDSNNLKITN